MTAGIDEAPAYRSGDLVAVADIDTVVVDQDGPWVEVVTDESGAVGFTVRESTVR